MTITYEQVQVWTTTDGRKWFSEEQAKNHEYGAEAAHQLRRISLHMQEAIETGQYSLANVLLQYSLQLAPLLTSIAESPEVQNAVAAKLSWEASF